MKISTFSNWRKYIEDGLDNNKLREIIMDYHSVKITNVYKHARIEVEIKGEKKRLECDLIIIGKTPSGQIRTFSLELKETDVSKVMLQAQIRRELFNYSYVVLNVSPLYLTHYLMNNNDIKFGVINKGEMWLNSLYNRDAKNIWLSDFAKAEEMREKKFRPFKADLSKFI